MKRKRYLTLVEIMVVILLIGLIGGVLAYNVGGSLEKGKACKTEIGGRRIASILTLAMAEGQQVSSTDWATIVGNSDFVGRSDQLVKDGWGNDYRVSIEDGEVLVSSDKYDEWLQKKRGRHEATRHYF